MLKTKHFPARSKLYRGAKQRVGNTNNISYFIFGNGGAQKAGDLYTKFNGNTVYTYETKSGLNLVMMNNKGSVKALMNTTDNDNIKKSISSAFITNNSPNVTRNSNNANVNRSVARHICNIGYDGYITNEMRQIGGVNKMHREIVLCRPGDKINYIRNNRPHKSLLPQPRKRTLAARPRNYSPNSAPGTPVRRGVLFNNNALTTPPRALPMRKLNNDNFRTP